MLTTTGSTVTSLATCTTIFCQGLCHCIGTGNHEDAESLRFCREPNVRLTANNVFAVSQGRSVGVLTVCHSPYNFNDKIANIN